MLSNKEATIDNPKRNNGYGSNGNDCYVQQTTTSNTTTTTTDGDVHQSCYKIIRMEVDVIQKIVG